MELTWHVLCVLHQLHSANELHRFIDLCFFYSVLHQCWLQRWGLQGCGGIMSPTCGELNVVLDAEAANLWSCCHLMAVCCTLQRHTLFFLFIYYFLIAYFNFLWLWPVKNMFLVEVWPEKWCETTYFLP